jgi:hypothetical protein
MDYLEKILIKGKLDGIVQRFFRGYARLGFSVCTEAVSYNLKIIPKNGKS